MKLKSFKQAQEYLFKHIPNVSTQLFPGEIGIKRAKYLLKLLGDPQNQLKVIHLAGTSGKGSTATLLSQLLESLGFKVGLILSPHLLDIRERIQINNKLISKEEFVKNLNEIMPILDKVTSSEFGSTTYFEVLIALAFYTFYKHKVNYVVAETGLGGLFDATNAATSTDKIAVLTKIGHDHTRILGNNLTKIAFQKAGIIQPHNLVLSAPQAKSVQEVFRAQAAKKQTSVIFLKKGKNFKNIKIDPQETRFDFEFQGLKFPVKLGLIGIHQAENCALALLVLKLLSDRDQFKINQPKLSQTLQNSHFPGRLEIKTIKGLTVILDGAHNLQKMKSLLTSLKLLYPNQKLDFLLAFKEGKDINGMLKLIKPFITASPKGEERFQDSADIKSEALEIFERKPRTFSPRKIINKVIVTGFFTTTQEFAKLSAKPQKLKKIFAKLGVKCQVIHDTKKALEQALKTENTLVITGSLYFLGEIYPSLKKYDS